MQIKVHNGNITRAIKQPVDCITDDIQKTTVPTQDLQNNS